MHPEIDELRPRLKEILYDCAVDIRATKAALYILDSSVRKFELVADFGFRSGIRPWAGYNDPLVDRCSRGRSPFFVNSVATEPKLSDMMFEAASERLLGVPIFSRGQMVGFIDIRDKQGKQPFEQPDALKAQSIGDRVLSLLTSKNLWNQRFVTLVDVPLVQPAAPKSNGGGQAPSPVPPSEEKPKALVVHEIVAAAKFAVSNLMLPSTNHELTEAEMVEAREALRGILLLPGVLAAVFTAGAAGVQEIASRGALTPASESALQSRLHAWLKSRGQSIGAVRTSFHTPLGVAAPEIAPEQLRSVLVAPVTTGGLNGMYLTVAFSQEPDPSTRELLTVMLDLLQTSIDHSLLFRRTQSSRLKIAEKLIEPDMTSFPVLRKHSELVASKSEAFARYLGLTGAEVENVRITAMVHDVGMRLLDYDNLYRKKKVSDEELTLLREHVTVGAAIVEPFLGEEIARAVLCHHERVDGAGYPGALRGPQIPLLSRIVQLCDAYVAITDPNTYQLPESHEAAIAIFGRGAGAQFDGELAARFVEMLRS